MSQLLEYDSVSAPHAQTLRLLLLAGPGAACNLNSSKSDLNIPTSPVLTWEITHDIYATLTQLATDPAVYDALVIDPEVITQAVLAAIPLLRKYRRLPVWVLDQGQNSPTIVRALNAGAIRVSEALVQHGQQRSAVLEEAPQADVPAKAPAISQRVDEHSQKGNIASPPSRENLKNQAGIVTDSHKNPPLLHNSISNAGAKSYDTATTEPLITDEEMRALLGP